MSIITQTQKGILAQVLLAPYFEKQKQMSDKLLPDFFTEEAQTLIAEIKNSNKKGVKYDYSHTNTEGVDMRIFGMLIISQYPLSDKNDFTFLLDKLRAEYIERSTSELTKLGITDINILKQKIDDIEQKASTLDEVQLRTLSEIVMSGLEQTDQNMIDVFNLPKTGFKTVDEMFDGFLEGDLVTFGGYTSTGKSTLMFSLIKNLSKTHDTLFFSLEMTERVVAARILSGISQAPFKVTLSLARDDTQKMIDTYGYREGLNKAVTMMSDFKVRIVDNVFDLDRITSTIGKAKEKYNLKFVVIDYVQLIQTPFLDNRKQRYEVLGHITKELKTLAKRLRIVIIILAQLGRSSISKEEPDLADIKESNCIVEDSDTVFLLYKDKDNGKRSLKLAKNRQWGVLGTAVPEYDFKTQSYI